jgi:hypothetical protein
MEYWNSGMLKYWAGRIGTQYSIIPLFQYSILLSYNHSFMRTQLTILRVQIQA